MSTLAEVAARAGVSAMTVSRVINNSGYASPAVRERVEAAVAELGFVPNALARSLHVKRTHTLALVLTDITNPFFTTMARGVEDAASARGYSVMFCNTDESAEKEQERVRVLLQKQVDGLLLVPACCSSAALELARRRTTPVVVLDRRVEGPPVDTVRCDSEGGAYAATGHLLALGHRDIAVLSGPPDVSVTVDRVAGYRRALAEAGIPERADRILAGRLDHASGVELARRALAAGPRPTALLATNNFISAGAYAALRERGLRVPGDISLAAFDDLPEQLLLDPFLTVVSQPAYEMGRCGTALLIDRLEGAGLPAAADIVLPTELIVRRSTATPCAVTASGVQDMTADNLSL